MTVTEAPDLLMSLNDSTDVPSGNEPNAARVTAAFASVCAGAWPAAARGPERSQPTRAIVSTRRSDTNRGRDGVSRLNLHRARQQEILPQRVVLEVFGRELLELAPQRIGLRAVGLVEGLEELSRGTEVRLHEYPVVLGAQHLQLHRVA